MKPLVAASGIDVHAGCMEKRLCAFEDCGKPAVSHSLCPAHRKQQRLGHQLRPLSRYKARAAEKPGHRVCTRCDQEFPATREFFFRQRHGLQAMCKQCVQGSPGTRERHLRYKYGIDQREYDLMLAEQEGVCAICGTSDAGGKHGVLHVDHDHATGNVRGLLCHRCNVSIGLFGEDTDVLSSAVDYLSKHRAPGLAVAR